MFFLASHVSSPCCPALHQTQDRDLSSASNHHHKPRLVASGQLTWKQSCLGLLDQGLVTDAFSLISPIPPLSPLRIALPT